MAQFTLTDPLLRRYPNLFQVHACLLVPIVCWCRADFFSHYHDYSLAPIAAIASAVVPYPVPPPCGLHRFSSCPSCYVHCSQENFVRAFFVLNDYKLHPAYNTGSGDGEDSEGGTMAKAGRMSAAGGATGASKQVLARSLARLLACLWSV